MMQTGYLGELQYSPYYGWGTALFFGVWRFPISALGATSDLRAPSTERDADKVRRRQTQPRYNHSLLHSLLYISLP